MTEISKEYDGNQVAGNAGAFWSRPPTGPAWDKAAEETNWLVYRLRPKQNNPAKMNKVPVDRSGTAVGKDEAAVLTLDEALNIARDKTAEAGTEFPEAGSYGIGYLAREGSALVGADMDHCIARDGSLVLWGCKILGVDDPAELGTYVEKSPSGVGLRVLVPREDGMDWFKEVEVFNDDPRDGGLGWFGGDNRFQSISGRALGKQQVETVAGLHERVQNAVEKLTGRKVAQKGAGAASDASLDDHWFYRMTDPDRQRAALETALDVLNVDDFGSVEASSTGGYGDWGKFTSALKSVEVKLGADWVFEIWNDWCEKCGGGTYDPSENKYKWDGWVPRQKDGATVKTIFWAAERVSDARWKVYEAAAGEARDKGEELPAEPVLWREARWEFDAIGEEAKAAAEVRSGADVQGSGAIAAPDADLIHDSVALWFVSQYGNQWLYDAQAGKWLQWDGSGWVVDDRGAAKALVREYLSGLRLSKALSGKKHARTRQRLGGSSFASGVLDIASTHPGFARLTTDFDNDPYLLGVPNGMVDLKTGTVVPPDPAAMVTKRTAVGPDPNMKTPLWDKFLQEATNGDADFIGYLQVLAGQCLIGKVTEEAFWFLFGHGGNGKGVFIGALQSVLGSYGTAAPYTLFAMLKHENHTTDIARLKGARLITISELPQGMTWNMTRIKEFTGREAKIVGRFLYQDNIEFDFTGSLVFVGNDKPSLGGKVDDAVTRRMNLLPFTFKPAKPDPALKDKLMAEYPGILSWMVEGARKYSQQGLVQPKVIKNASQDYLHAEDPLRNFLEEETVGKPNGTYLLKDFLSDFRQWCVDSDILCPHRHPKTLKAELEKRGYSHRKSMNGQAVVGVERIVTAGGGLTAL